MKRAEESQRREKPHGQNARENLIEAGITLFAKKGYASTSVREIVAKAGVTKPVLYYYFKNKEGIFRSILNLATELQEAILTEVAEKRGTVLDQLIHLYRCIHQGVMENQQLFKMMHNLIYGSPQGAPHYNFAKYHRRMVEAIREVYARGLAKQEVVEADPEEVAILVLSFIDYCLHLDLVHPESLDSNLPVRLLQLAFHGMNNHDDFHAKKARQL